MRSESLKAKLIYCLFQVLVGLRRLEITPKKRRLGVSTPDTRQELLLLVPVDTRVRRRLNSRLLEGRGMEVVRDTSWSHSGRSQLQGRSNRFS